MSLKSRVRKLTDIEGDTTIIFFNTIYEGRDGREESRYSRAYSPSLNKSVFQEAGETQEDFRARVAQELGPFLQTGEEAST